MGRVALKPLDTTRYCDSTRHWGSCTLASEISRVVHGLRLRSYTSVCSMIVAVTANHRAPNTRNGGTHLASFSGLMFIASSLKRPMRIRASVRCMRCGKCQNVEQRGGSAGYMLEDWSRYPPEQGRYRRCGTSHAYRIRRIEWNAYHAVGDIGKW
jgi:hypothetical protein